MKTYFLMVNGEYYSAGTFSEIKKEGLKLAEKAKKGFILPVSDEKIKTIKLCMYNITLYENEN